MKLLRTTVIAAVVAVASVTLAACGANEDPLAKNGTGSGSAESDGSIVVGGANFTESKVLAEIYAGALNAEGVEASTQPDIGSREAYLRALQDGSVDIFPEYTGNLALNYNDKLTASSAVEWYDLLKQELPSDLVAYDMSPAQDNDAFTVTKETADKYDLKTISDVKPYAKDMIIGGPPEWKTRTQGLPGLEKVYGLQFKGEYKSLSGSLPVEALLNDQVQATNIFTTNPAVDKYNFVQLEDDKHLFPLSNVVPIANKAATTPKIENTLNEVSAKLDTETLRDLDKQVDVDGMDVGSVATEWLESNGLA